MNANGRDGGRPSPGRVEEFQGLYGPYHVSERLLQKIWLRGELDLSRLRTVSGRGITIHRVGEWNLLGGPDFVGADLEIDGTRITGDIEIHFRQEDWYAHRHHLDPAYDRVVLHLVLFPPDQGSSSAVTHAGDPIETASMVDLLWHDLEEYAISEEAALVSTLSGDRMAEELLSLPLNERRDRLFRFAEGRWAQKIHFARVRMEKLGWVGACHATALEVLGYSRNRPGMLAVADRTPLEAWSAPGFEPGFLLERTDIPWQRQGVRPANQPGRRLKQYAAMCAGRPAWPDRLVSWAQGIPETGGGVQRRSVRDLRKALRLTGLRKDLREQVIRGAVAGPRMDSMVVDAFLPLLATRDAPDLFQLWFVWPVGDMPAGHRSILRQIGVAGSDRGHPFAHGWFQGLLGLLLEIPNPS